MPQLCLPRTEQGLYKPAYFVPNRHNTDPQWAWVWDKRTWCAPLLEGSGAPRDSGLGGLSTNIAGSGGWLHTRIGPVLQTPRWEFTIPSIAVSPPLTMAVVVRMQTTGSLYQLVMAIGSGIGNQCTFSVDNDASAGVNLVSPWTETPGGNFSNLSLSIPSSTTDYFAICCSLSNTTNNRLVARNLDTGALYATSAAAEAWTMNASTLIRLGRDWWGGDELVGEIGLALWSQAAWGEAEIYSWVHNPFGFLRPARRRAQYYTEATAGGGPSFIYTRSMLGVGH